MNPCAHHQAYCWQRILFAVVAVFCIPKVVSASAPEAEAFLTISERAQFWLDNHPGFVRDYEQLCPAGPARNQHIPVQYALEGPARVYNNGNLPDRHVILSFDDGPHAVYTELTLMVLNKCRIQAHFFPVGRQANRPEKAALMRKMTKMGHMVGSHSYTHANLKYIRTSRAREEILLGHNAITQATGVFRPFFRFPFGSGNRTPRLLKILEKRGMVSLLWSIAVPDISVHNPERLLQRTLKKVRKRGRGVLLMHDVKQHTLLMLPKLVRVLDEEGYTFAVLDPDVEPGSIARKDSGMDGNEGGLVGGAFIARGAIMRPPIPAPRP
jgi:peptidoglycan/xylan/chitin deacetylase (PgdA/CDA1 family)